MPSFLVASYFVGRELDREPEFIPDTAFVEMLNLYCWRGRVRRRYGNTYLDRLRRKFTSVSLGSLDANGDIAANLKNSIGVSAVTEPDAMIEPGSVVVTIAGGTPTVLVENSPADGTLTVQSGPLTLTSSEIDYQTGVITLDTNGALNAVTFDANYFPCLPVMGLPQRDTDTLNFSDNLAFDTTYAYLYDQVSSEYDELSSAMSTTWNGDNYQLFWTLNASSVFWATNNVEGFQFYSLNNITNANPGVFTTTVNHAFNVNDPVVILNVSGMTEVNGKYYLINSTPAANTFTVKDPVTGTAVDTTAFGAYGGGGVAHTPTIIVNSAVDGIRYYQPESTATWVNFSPPVSTTAVMTGALMLFTYRNRIVALNTFEGISDTGNTQYPQRARWSQNGTPFYSSPVPAREGVQEDAWRDDLFGKGGYDDAPTNEWIIGAGFVRDTLIVFFEKSTWLLRYTGNEYKPFQWERRNTELGCDSTFSVGSFDQMLRTISDRGIIASDTVNTQRIDSKIPDEVFKINNANNGRERVFGHRDFIRRLFYWAYPSWFTGSNQFFNNRVFVYNYEEDSWGQFKDSITCFGEFQPGGDITWALTAPAFYSITWESDGVRWNSGLQQQENPYPVVGNQQGYVLLFQQQVKDGRSLFIKSMTIANPGILEIPNHNLEDGDFIQIGNVISGAATVTAGVGALTDINGQIFTVDIIDADTVYIRTLTSASPPTFTRAEIAGNYLGGGEVSVRQNFILRSKRFNPFLNKDSKIRLNRTDFFVQSTTNGEFTYKLYQDTNNSIQVNEPYDPLNTRSDVIETYATAFQLQDQDKTWIRNKDQVDGQFFQFVLTLSPNQMIDDTIQGSDFVLHAMNFEVEQSGRLV